MSNAIVLSRGTKVTIKHKRHTIELEPKNVCTNHVIFSWEYNPHNVRPWLISDISGPVCITWGDCEQDALDVAADLMQLEHLRMDDDCTDEKDGVTGLGNASIPYDLTDVRMEELDLSKQSVRFMCALAEARVNSADNLDE